jgi:hypothetical protein
MKDLVTLDTVNGINQYHVDVRAAGCDGFSDWYEEAVFFNQEKGCTFSFYREGTLVAFVKH